MTPGAPGNFSGGGSSGGLTDAELRASPVDVDIQQVGGATFTLGQQLAAASLPVVLTAAQISTLTPLATVAVTQSGTWDEVGINDSGNSITVDNAGLTELAAAINASSQMDVNIAASNATITVASHAVTNAGTFAVQDATAQASLSVMDDWDNAASDGASVSGDVAHDAVDAGEPVKIGYRAFSPDGTTPGTAVAENDRTNAKGDLDGRQFVNDEHPRWWSYHLNTSTAQTDTSVQADPGDGFQIVITDIQFSNGAATAINMFLEEGLTTIWGPIYLEAINGRGYVWKGKKHVTASTALTLTTSSSTAHSVEILGYIQAV